MEKKILAKIFIVLTILILVTFGYSQRSVGLNFIFPQGDNHLYLLNTENHTISEFVTFFGKIIWGITFFSVKNSEYFGYIEAFEDDTSNFSFYFKYAKVYNLLDITEIPISVSENEFLDDLTVHYVDETPIFTTIVSKGKTEALTVTNLLQFTINGTIISKINYILPEIPVAKILDITYFDYDKYLILTTLGDNEKLNSMTKHILCYSMNGSSYNSIDISEQSFSLAYHKSKNIIFTSGENSINIWDLDGNFKKVIKISFTPSEINIRNMTHLLIREYRNNYSGLLYIGFLLTIIGFPLIIFVKYSKRKRF